MGDVPKGSEAHGTQLHWVWSGLDFAHHFGLPDVGGTSICVRRLNCPLGDLGEGQQNDDRWLKGVLF